MAHPWREIALRSATAQEALCDLQGFWKIRWADQSQSTARKRGERNRPAVRRRHPKGQGWGPGTAPRRATNAWPRCSHTAFVIGDCRRRQSRIAREAVEVAVLGFQVAEGAVQVRYQRGNRFLTTH